MKSKTDEEEATAEFAVAIIRLKPSEAWQDKTLTAALELVGPDGTGKLVPFEPMLRPEPSHHWFSPQPRGLTPELVRNTLGEAVDPFYGPPGGN